MACYKFSKRSNKRFTSDKKQTNSAEDSITQDTMSLRVIFPLLVLFGACSAMDLSSFVPGKRSCSLKYNSVTREKAPWRCDETKFEQYPSQQINTLLSDPGYVNVSEYRRITKDCQRYNDVNTIGSNTYYKYESICKMIRTPVKMLWARIPDYVIPPTVQSNNGLLPVYVLDDQYLYDVECVHPWSVGLPKDLKPSIRNRLRRIRFTGAKKHLCLVGYAYNYNLVCAPTGYMSREVLVYSIHANRIFNLVVPDVPTSCACTQCQCTKPARTGRRPAIV